MNFHEFTKELIKQLTPLFPEGTDLFIESMPKNNGVIYEALIIREPGINLSPTIYLEHYYSLFKDDVTMDEICHMICELFMEVRLNHPIDPGFFTDYERAKKQLIFHLVNYEKNRSRLDSIPHIPYLDLAIIFSCIIQLGSGKTASILIKKEHLQLWDVDFEDIKKQAFANTPRLLPAYIQPITDAIRDLIEADPTLKRFVPLIDPGDAPPLYVLTNEEQFHGASCILYPSILEEFAESIGTDFYVLPSSINEVILLPVPSRVADQELCSIVRSVNREQLPAIQQLSDSVYYYSRASQQLTL